MHNNKKLYGEEFHPFAVLPYEGTRLMSPGEFYVEYLTFEPYFCGGEPTESGEYNGICYFYTVPDEHYSSYGERTKHSVDFSVTFKQNDQTPQ